MESRPQVTELATVVHNWSVGLSLISMVDFNIYSLDFTSYSRSWGYGSQPASSSALLLQSTQYAKLVNCSFHDNFGTALTVYNTNATLAEKEFIHNQCASEIYETGCGITALNSNLIFTGKTIFLGNSASFRSRYSAGAVWASASSLHFTGINNFIGNSAHSYSGGAIHAEANTFLSFIGTSNFNHNSAYSGGAIYTSGNVVLTFNGTNNFINNSANFEGGAIYAIYTFGKFIGSSTFSHNSAHSASTCSGGAILTRYSVVLTFDGISNFFNNSAGHFRYGGAIFAVTNILLHFIGTSNTTCLYSYKYD